VTKEIKDVAVEGDDAARRTSSRVLPFDRHFMID